MFSARWLKHHGIPALATDKRYSLTVFELLAMPLFMLVGLARENFKVPWPVVILFAILMMNVFFSFKRTLNHLFRNKSVFKDITIFSGVRVVRVFNKYVPLFGSHPATVPARVRLHRLRVFRSLFWRERLPTLLMALHIPNSPTRLYLRWSKARMLNNLATTTTTRRTVNLQGGLLWVAT